MTTLTIPYKSIKDDLVIISRKELGRLLSIAQKPKKTKLEDIELLAFEAKASKNTVGPFSNTKELFQSLGI